MVEEKIVLIVEGGKPGGERNGRRGKRNDLSIRCREGFKSLLSKAQIKDSRFTIIAGGSRDQAYKKFKSKVNDRNIHERCILLVDSEDAVNNEYQKGNDKTKWQPWGYLKVRDGWQMPAGTGNNDCHLMVRCMENWLLADNDALKNFFGGHFKASKLPNIPHIQQGGIEGIEKRDVHRKLEQATEGCGKKFKASSKGALPYKVLGEISADKLLKVSPWFKRLIQELKR